MITNNCDPDVNSLRNCSGFDGQNECQRIGHIPIDSGIYKFSTHIFARLARVCLAPSGRRTCGVGRKPRAALRGCAATRRPGISRPLRFAVDPTSTSPEGAKQSSSCRGGRAIIQVRALLATTRERREASSVLFDITLGKLFFGRLLTTKLAALFS